SYAVIFAAGYFSATHARFYQALIPAGTLILKSDKSLSLNNTGGDSITVITPLGDTIISMHYDNKADKGFSLEKMAFTGGDGVENYAPSNWVNGTPGRRNSVGPAKFDLSIKTPLQVIGDAQQLIRLSCKVFNAGELSFGKGCIVHFYKDSNSNAHADQSELVDSYTLGQDLNPKDSLQINFSFTPLSTVTTKFIFTLTDALDENPKNDTVSTTLVIRTIRNSVVMNEILYEPVQNPDDFIQDQPDYIELYNRSNEPINLHGWSISDKPNENGEFDTYLFAEDPSGNYLLQPGEYAVVSPDKATRLDSTRLVLYYPYLQTDSKAKPFYVSSRSTFSLNNEGDLVLLKDKTGAVVDSVLYSPEWHNAFYASTQGKSLERLNPDFPSNDQKNWTTSTDRMYGGTPGKQNTVYTPSPLAHQTASLAIEPRTFSPDSDGHDDFAIFSYKLPGQASRIRVKIFDIRGRLIQTLANSLPSGANGQVIWDGRDQSGKIARMGIYLILLEALNANDGVTTTVKNTVVLAKRLN
ncbi:hypothetical protein HGB07_05055, partial [Candidatus Roizmanbacteria bacterium]|nr:hypothetical protein [Candidatus Roizmanbacteria bacterium]